MSLCNHLESDTEGRCALCNVYLCELCEDEEATVFLETGEFLCYWCASGDTSER